MDKQIEYKCPSCKKVSKIVDVDKSGNMVQCRKCGNIGIFINGEFISYRKYLANIRSRSKNFKK